MESWGRSAPQPPPLINGLRGTFGAETIFGVVFQKLVGLIGSLLGPIWPYLALLGPYWALFGSIGPYLALLGPYWALFGSIGPYLALTVKQKRDTEGSHRGHRIKVFFHKWTEWQSMSEDFFKK